MRGIAIAFTSSAILMISPVMAADTPPRLDTSGVNMQPAYPASALKNSERGAAVIGVNVSETGKVNYVYPLKTSGFDDLDAAATVGVMGWRFVPATSNEKAVAGDTAVEIVFQPPAQPSSTGQPVAESPDPKGDFLPASIQMQAKRAWYHNEDHPVLCSSGTLRSTVEFQHTLGAAAWGWAPAASLHVNTGEDDEVVLQMLGHELITPPEESFILKRHQGTDEGVVSYSHATTLGRPETVSLSWDSSGLVTATVGGMETHQARLKGPPGHFVLSISSGEVNFTNSILICKPDGST
jgi:TonB family protein